LETKEELDEFTKIKDEDIVVDDNKNDGFVTPDWLK
jgi:hypothetical protein